MQVLAGKYKRKKLSGSADNSIRPTTNKIKEFIFNILQDFPENKNVADFFSGSGSLGIEALSRGAKHVVFIDDSLKSIQVLKNNLKYTGILPTEYEIINNDAIKFCQQRQSGFDLILMDPPFIYPAINELIQIVFMNQILKKKGLFVVEHEISNPVNSKLELFEIIKQKKFGRSLISFLINKGREND
jgi:16S rRNA (guanine966-N2)-methyltransferase